jgi:two-component system LytT family response regulator
MKLKVVIVDDETLARSRLRKLLDREADLDVIAECSNGREAIACIRQRKPDLVFLDVQMPEVDGFDVLRALPEGSWPAIVFVTAHDQHAIQAFEINALDYLLKPFSHARLLGAVARARKHFETRDTASLNQQLAMLLKTTRTEAPYLQRIAVKNGSETNFIKVEEIDCIESAANYAVVETQTGNHVLRETLTSLEAKLPPRSFLRISRSIIVNLDRVKALQSHPPGEALIVLRNGRQLVMTRGIREMQERLQYAGEHSR